MLFERKMLRRRQFTVVKKYQIFFEVFARREQLTMACHLILLNEFRETVPERRHRTVQMNLDGTFRCLHQFGDFLNR